MNSSPWRVLVLFGASGSGKSTAARELGRRFGVPWLQVDDLRIAMQFSNAVLPEYNDALYWFLNHPDHVGLPTGTVLSAFIGTAKAMAPAVRIDVDSHVVTDEPVILEGDGILPALCLDPVLARHTAAGLVRWCCIETGSPREIVDNLRRRGRGVDQISEVNLLQHATSVAAYGEWLRDQCLELGVPVVPTAPQADLTERITHAVSGGPSAAAASTRPDW